MQSCITILLLNIAIGLNLPAGTRHRTHLYFCLFIFMHFWNIIDVSENKGIWKEKQWWQKWCVKSSFSFHYLTCHHNVDRSYLHPWNVLHPGHDIVPVFPPKADDILPRRIQFKSRPPPLWQVNKLGSFQSTFLLTER